jgi:nicotinamidase-related amidase
MSQNIAKSGGLRHGALSPRTVHLCVDMQRLFAEETPWQTPWMARVLPKVIALVHARPSQTVFTRFIPATRASEGAGVWARYWERWAELTLERLPQGLCDLVPELARFVPPAVVIDKKVYSPWLDQALETELRRRNADTLVVSGAETDVCVLATVLGAIDRGYRVIVLADAICSSSDETHDASMKVYEQRYTEQVETIDTAALLKAWATTAGIAN